MKNATKEWEAAWPADMHKTEYALKRIKSAQKADMTPVKIDKNDLYGYFQGSHGRYETFLDTCDCVDFRRNHKPCKHVYRLAMELGVLDASFIADASKIVDPKEQRASTSETIAAVESLTAEAKAILYIVSYNLWGKKQGETFVFECEKEQKSALEEIINAGILLSKEDPAPAYDRLKKNDMKKLLKEHNIPYDTLALKPQILELCKKTLPKDILMEYCPKIVFTLTDSPIYSIKKIHKYLNRKLGTVAYLGEDGEITELPLLETLLPDDDVTQELIKRGYYDPVGKIKVERLHL